ncbi:tetratricopeptide repeat protein [Geomonas terrae]|uniref:Tetratricopeptide repeat protein n=1 Tax=Geomonas terrae TaxID=2562681 RepID=A0A4S1CGL9_9BACT|nr:CheR family methyltransferase [Geomonas terrae]TGU72689.1 tetratricopeptide repeat protein [Geomonas terrae]
MAESQTSATLQLFAAFVAKELGLHFRKERFSELAQKMATLAQQEGVEDLERYLLQLMSVPLGKDRLRLLASALTIGETYFLRDPKSYQVLEEQVLPGLVAARRRGNRTIRIWSAGCSTGEEPYSIAIILSRVLRDTTGWKITILGTDLNEHALERARLGVYGKWSFRNAPGWLMNYFSQRPDGSFEIANGIREMVRFGHLNLAEDADTPSPIAGGADVIFCRNVMLYFHEEQIEKTVARFRAALRPGGWLFMGPTEVDHHKVEGFTCHIFDGALALKRSEPRQKATRAEFRVPADAPAPQPGAHPGRVVGRTVTSAAGKQPPANKTAGGPELHAAPASADAPQGPDLLQQALSLFDTGAYEKAAEVALAGAQHAEHLALAARCHANLGRYDEARELCERSIRLERLNPHSHYLLSMIREQTGDEEGAVTSLKHALYLDHDYLLAYFALGNLFRKRGERQEAEQSFGNALRLLQRLDPNEAIPDTEGMTAGMLIHLIKGISRR